MQYDRKLDPIGSVAEMEIDKERLAKIQLGAQHLLNSMDTVVHTIDSFQSMTKTLANFRLGSIGFKDKFDEFNDLTTKSKFLILNALLMVLPSESPLALKVSELRKQEQTGQLVIEDPQTFIIELQDAFSTIERAKVDAALFHAVVDSLESLPLQPSPLGHLEKYSTDRINDCAARVGANQNGIDPKDAYEKVGQFARSYFRTMGLRCVLESQWGAENFAATTQMVNEGVPMLIARAKTALFHSGEHIGDLEETRLKDQVEKRFCGVRCILEILAQDNPQEKFQSIFDTTGQIGKMYDPDGSYEKFKKNAQLLSASFIELKDAVDRYFAPGAPSEEHFEYKRQVAREILKDFSRMRDEWEGSTFADKKDILRQLNTVRQWLEEFASGASQEPYTEEGLFQKTRRLLGAHLRKANEYLREIHTLVSYWSNPESVKSKILTRSRERKGLAHESGIDEVSFSPPDAGEPLKNSQNKMFVAEFTRHPPDNFLEAYSNLQHSRVVDLTKPGVGQVGFLNTMEVDEMDDIINSHDGSLFAVINEKGELLNGSLFCRNPHKLSDHGKVAQRYLQMVAGLEDMDFIFLEVTASKRGEKIQSTLESYIAGQGEKIVRPFDMILDAVRTACLVTMHPQHLPLRKQVVGLWVRQGLIPNEAVGNYLDRGCIDTHITHSFEEFDPLLGEMGTVDYKLMYYVAVEQDFALVAATQLSQIHAAPL